MLEIKGLSDSVMVECSRAILLIKIKRKVLLFKVMFVTIFMSAFTETNLGILFEGTTLLSGLREL